MGWRCENLGNGLWNVTDDGTNTQTPYVSFNGTIAANPQLTQNFGRILNQQLNDNEQMMLDKPQIFDGTYEYVGVANNTALPSDPVWMVIRKSWSANRVVKVQYRPNVAWTHHVNGWL